MPACFFWFDRFLSASQSKRMMLYITYNTRLDARAGGKLRSVAQRRPMCRHRASHGALGNWLDSGVTGTKSLSRRCRRRRVALTPSSSGANGKRFADAGREGQVCRQSPCRWELRKHMVRRRKRLRHQSRLRLKYSYARILPIGRHLHKSLISMSLDPLTVWGAGV